MGAHYSSISILEANQCNIFFRIPYLLVLFVFEYQSSYMLNHLDL
jgi:hypothetical protein